MCRCVEVCRCVGVYKWEEYGVCVAIARLSSLLWQDEMSLFA